MKKPIKIVLGAVIALVAIVLIIVLALPLWIGPVATGVANAVVPGITGTDFKLGRFALNPYSGVLQVGDLDLSNPTNYKEKTAVKLDNFKVNVGVCSLASDVIHVEEVSLDGLYVYASGLTGANFQDIAKHATGGDSKKEKTEEKKPAAEAKKPEAESKPGKKVCIDRLSLKNIKIKIGMMPAMPVPTIELTDLGKPKEANGKSGITFEELWKTLLEKVMAAAGSMGDGLKALGNLTGDGAKALGNLTSDGAKALGNLTSDGAKALGDGAGQATKALGDGAKAVGAGAGKAVDAVGAGAGKAVDAVGAGAGKAVDAVGEGAGKAVDAVGEGAKKAADALKSLF